MPKKNSDTENQWGRQTPDGSITWRSELIAQKIGWTTAEGRAREQLSFDNSIAQLGVTTGDSTQLKFYTRVQYIAYTEPTLVVDGTEETFTGEPESPQALEQIQAWLDQADPPTAVVSIPVVQDPHTIVLDTDVHAATDAVATPAPAQTIVINNVGGPVPPALKAPIPPKSQS